jgi:hypothetical protein
MSETGNRTSAFQIGIAGAIVTVTGILLSGPLAILVVSLIQAQPPWQSPDVFVEHFHRVQVLPFYFGFLLISGSLLMITALHQLSEDRGRTLVGLIFTSIAAGLIFFNYLVQTTVVPALVSEYNTALGPIISLLSMSNPKSLSWAIEMWGYGFLGLGTWLCAGFFADHGVERVAKLLFVANGVLSMIGALWTSWDLGWVLAPAGLAAFGVWNLLYLGLAIALYVVLRRRESASA